MGIENEVPDPIGFDSEVPAVEQIKVKQTCHGDRFRGADMLVAHQVCATQAASACWRE